MDYHRIYQNLVEKARLRSKPSVFETHHIIPRSLGGDDSSENLVVLTPREHYVAHWLLWKIHSGTAKHKMAFAFFAMASMNNKNQKREVSSRDFERAKAAMMESARTRESHRCHKGKRFYTNGVEEAFFDLGQQPEGWRLGRSENYKTKIRESKKRPNSKKWNREQAIAAASKSSKGKHWWVNPSTGEQKRSDDQPEGFIKGSRVWYTDGNDNLQCVEGFQPEGWNRGRTISWRTRN